MATSRWQSGREKPIVLPPRGREGSSHLEQPSVVGVVVLVVSALLVHLVPLAGPDQLLGVVELSWVQRVGVDQTHQVLFVVLPAGTHDTRRPRQHDAFTSHERWSGFIHVGQN